MLSLWVIGYGLNISEVCLHISGWIRCHILNLSPLPNNISVPVQQEAAEKMSPQKIQTRLTVNRTFLFTRVTHLLPPTVKNISLLHSLCIFFYSALISESRLILSPVSLLFFSSLLYMSMILIVFICTLPNFKKSITTIQNIHFLTYLV